MVIRYVMAEYPHETYMEEDAGGNYVLHSDYAALEARVAELEKDVARYRWLRDSNGINRIPLDFHGLVEMFSVGVELDADIDTLMEIDEA